MHRSDYMQVLYDEARRLGVGFMFGCDVVDVDFEAPRLRLASGEALHADVVVACDGACVLAAGDDEGLGAV